MKRIRKVDYYHRVALSVVAPLAVACFLRELFAKRLSMPAVGAAALLAEECMTAVPACGLVLPAGALDEILGGPIEDAGLPPERGEGLMDLVRAALDALRPPSVRHHHDLGDPQFWTLGNALMPFTDVSLPFMLKVRQCRLCTCWVRDGDELCPFCFLPSPGGKARRAWVRARIVLVPLPTVAAGYAFPSGTPAGRWTNPAATGEDGDSLNDADPDEDDVGAEDEPEDDDGAGDPEEE